MSPCAPSTSLAGLVKAFYRYGKDPAKIETEGGRERRGPLFKMVESGKSAKTAPF